MKEWLLPIASIVSNQFVAIDANWGPIRDQALTIKWEAGGWNSTCGPHQWLSIDNKMLGEAIKFHLGASSVIKHWQ